MRKIRFILQIMVILAGFALLFSQEPDLSFFNEEHKPLDQKFDRLKLGEIQPEGWLKKQMERDVKKGLVRYFDSLVPKHMNDKLFGENRRDTLPESDNVWHVDKMWWRGEQQGYWWDGLLRNSYLVGFEEGMNRIKKIVEYLLDSQDPSGYLGIYGPDLRYKNFDGNGELWTQARALHVLLTWYEITGDNQVLMAIKRAVDRTMEEFNGERKNPFDVHLQGGSSHGLLIAEDIAWLYRITEEDKYRNYVVWLYHAYSKAKKYDNDIHYSFLSDPDQPFIGHSVHSFEHLRVLLNVWYFSGYEELEQCYQNYLKKLDRVTLPSGAGFGFENMWGLEAHPDSTPVEYCAITELQMSSLFATRLTGDKQMADRAEKMFYNTAQGNRLPDNRAVAYCKPDNCYRLDGELLGYYRPDEGIGYHKDDERYKYSPTHVDVALCCAPQSTRIYPNFVANMWMRSEAGLVAVLYGPSKVETKIGKTPVEIIEKTNYPFSDSITMDIQLNQPKKFEIKLRIPEWAGDFNVAVKNAKTYREEGYFVIDKTWNNGDQINISMQPEIKTHAAKNGEKYLQRGPLVYAYSIPAKAKIVKDYDLHNFYDQYYFTKDYIDHSFKLLDEGQPAREFELNIDNMKENPWIESPIYLKGQMYSEKKDEIVEVKLVPFGCTNLRKTTFSSKK